MRGRLVLLVAATTSLVLVAFLVPLAILVRGSAADRATNDTIVELEALVPIVATGDDAAIDGAVQQANARGPGPVTVFLPDGRVFGAPAARSPAVERAATGRSLTADTAGGREVVIAVAGLGAGTAVIRSFVPDADLNRGVAHAWAILGLLGLGLLLLSVLVAYQLARTLTRPLTDVAEVSHRLAGGDLTARANATGPVEVRQVSEGLNQLAGRIDELMASERERVADLSHRLRTPLTALRIDAESLPDPEDRARLGADLDAFERTVNALIDQARRPVRDEAGRTCDAATVVAERARYWSALADEEQRRMDVTLDADSVPVRVGADDLAACIDALVGNVFAHTPEGCAMELRLGQRPRAGAVLVVADEGPGLPGPVALRRGHSGSGSTGLGLDIVRHIAHRSGGGVSFGRSPAGGAMITVELGPAVPAPVRGGRGFRTAGMAPAVRRAARHRATKTTATQTSATQTSATQRDAT